MTIQTTAARPSRNRSRTSFNAETQRARSNAEEQSIFFLLSLRSSANLCVSALTLRLDSLELAAQFSRDDWRVIRRQAGVENMTGHKECVICFRWPQFYAPPPPSTSRETARAKTASTSQITDPAPLASRMQLKRHRGARRIWLVRLHGSLCPG